MDGLKGRWNALAPRERGLLVAALALGLAERLALGLRKLDYHNTEAGRVAVAIAHGHGFADVFFPGQGPTAHLMPITPMIAGGVLTIFGVGALGQAVLTLWGIAVTAGVYALAALCIGVASRNVRAAYITIVTLCILPLHLFDEAVRWRAWDAGLGTLLALSCLFIVLRGERGPVRHFLIWKAVLPAATFIVNPITGLMTGAIAAFSTLRHRRRDGVFRPLLMMAVCLALVLTPWVVRNMIVMHHPILTRDNLGMELTLANNPGAVHPTDTLKAVQAQLDKMHPTYLPEVQARMMRMGEVAYNQDLLQGTVAWMRAHPSDVAQIWMRHLREALFPPPWLFSFEHEPSARFDLPRAVVADLITAGALLGLGAAALRRDWIYGYFGLFLVIPVFLVLPFEVVLRYTWVLYAISVGLGIDWLLRVLARRQADPTTEAHP